MVDEGSELTGPERRLRGALRILAAIFAAASVVCLALVIPGQSDAVEAALVVHSLARLAVLAGLAAIAAADVRRFAALIVVHAPREEDGARVRVHVQEVLGTQLGHD